MSTFVMHMRCNNCLADGERHVAVPEDDPDAPTDVEEFLLSGVFAAQKYVCEDCENPIAALVAVTQKDASGERYVPLDPPDDTEEFYF